MAAISEAMANVRRVELTMVSLPPVASSAQYPSSADHRSIEETQTPRARAITAVESEPRECRHVRGRSSEEQPDAQRPPGALGIMFLEARGARTIDQS